MEHLAMSNIHKLKSFMNEIFLLYGMLRLPAMYDAKIRPDLVHFGEYPCR